MRNTLQTKVGLRIKDLRAINDVSQERFANKIGMDRTYLASIEVGQRNVTLQNLAKIANGFDMTLSEFFEGIPRIDPSA
ncbi:helix-turn-helix transcriptional regulator [Eggerthella guodeyinii]|uniref:Helix-turn-helix domain-containing protein n=2 Tax=Eggerthella TaxID=84111 RepID=A0A6N7RKE3_9ACTN|nr:MULTISPECIES: helix-turn-helix transcriptional regulator [Eggerthella]MBC5583353.1 helix-turn-helix transcriptional regulator [Eggerthella hominis]MRX81417.1 helix-turn-helix domain-containing protein [Eggerthella guodeyinii]QOS67049.1 helix-turn-helix transcriptional regulator [Eggerthella guodeyinii]